MKKILLYILCMTLALGSLMGMAGCNTTSEAEKRTVRVVAHTQMQEYLDPFFAEFMLANPDIKVEGLYGVDQVGELETSLPPDLLFAGNVDFANLQVFFADLNGLIDEEFNNNAADIAAFKAKFLPNMLEYSSYDDRLLVLPQSANVGLLYYNKALFTNNSQALPTADWTYDDYIAAGKAMTKKEADGKYTQWGASLLSQWWGEWLTYVRQFGGDFYAANGETPAFNTAEFKKGIQFYKDKVVGANKFAANPASTVYGEGDLGGFIGRATAMEYGGHTGNWTAYNATSGLNWDVEQLPTPNGLPNARGSEIAVEGWGISKKSTNKASAMKLLMYLYSEAGEKIFAAMGKLMPTVSFKNSVLAIPKAERSNPQNMEAVFAAMEKSMPLPANKNFSGSASAPVWNELLSFLKGSITIDQFVTNATANVNAYVKTQG